MPWVAPFPTGSTVCFRAACRGTANPIPPRPPRAPIPAFGLLEPAGRPPFRPAPMFSSEISRNLPPNSIASEDKSSLPTSYYDTHHESRVNHIRGGGSTYYQVDEFDHCFTRIDEDFDLFYGHEFLEQLL